MTAREWRGVIAVLIALVIGLTLVRSAADYIDGVPRESVASTAGGAGGVQRAPTLAPMPQCESPLALLLGKESLVLRRHGNTATIIVMYDGVERGQLIHIDLDSHTLWAATQPTFGWKVGAR